MVDDELTEAIIGTAYAVHNKLGSGFLEKVYENALRIANHANTNQPAKPIPLILKIRLIL